jgi:hypothetical protein
LWLRQMLLMVDLLIPWRLAIVSADAKCHLNADVKSQLNADARCPS